MTIPILDESKVLAALALKQNPYFAEYHAFYSSWFGGIIKDPHWMLLPMDDHMVHRGDGVFEAMKAVNRRVYLMDPHLKRLKHSADRIDLKLPVTLDELKNIILATLQAANRDNAIVRLYLSRGPGNFSVNPYDSLGAQIYVVVADLKAPAETKYQQGVVIGQSHIPCKESWMAQVKSCNYLPNVMMKKEAVDRGLDFVINLDDNNCIAEGSTENIMMVNADGVLIHPEFDHILKGTMMLRAFELAQQNGIKTAMQSIFLDDLLHAKEVMMAGTTLDVLPVVKFENQMIGNGSPGTVVIKLRALLLEDMQRGPYTTAF